MPFRRLPPADLPSSRHPFEIFMLVVCVVVGLPILFGNPPPPSVDALMPLWARIIWSVLVAGGALTALIGVALPQRLAGVFVEQVGLVAVGVGTVVYALCSFVYNDIQLALPAAMILAFGVACLWRWVQLERLIALAYAAQEEEPG